MRVSVWLIGVGLCCSMLLSDVAEGKTKPFKELVIIGQRLKKIGNDLIKSHSKYGPWWHKVKIKPSVLKGFAKLKARHPNAEVHSVIFEFEMYFVHQKSAVYYLRTMVWTDGTRFGFLGVKGRKVRFASAILMHGRSVRRSLFVKASKSVVQALLQHKTVAIPFAENHVKSLQNAKISQLALLFARYSRRVLPSITKHLKGLPSLQDLVPQIDDVTLFFSDNKGKFLGSIRGNWRYLTNQKFVLELERIQLPRSKQRSAKPLVAPKANRPQNAIPPKKRVQASKKAQSKSAGITRHPIKSDVGSTSYYIGRYLILAPKKLKAFAPPRVLVMRRIVMKSSNRVVEIVDHRGGHFETYYQRIEKSNRFVVTNRKKTFMGIVTFEGKDWLWNKWSYALTLLNGKGLMTGKGILSGNSLKTEKVLILPNGHYRVRIREQFAHVSKSKYLMIRKQLVGK